MGREQPRAGRFQVYDLGIGHDTVLIGARPFDTRTSADAIVAQTIRWLQGLRSDSRSGRSVQSSIVGNC